MMEIGDHIQVALGKNEVCRYMGYEAGHKMSARISSLVDAQIESAYELMEPAYSYVIRDIEGVDGHRVFVGDSVVFDSRVIAELLGQCYQVAAFLATIGGRLEKRVRGLAKEGRVLEATILDAAHKAGIWIPTLCYHPSVSSQASCRLCMVELGDGDRKQLVTSCNYPVRRDIVVSVTSERAVRARRGVMELLLARAPESEELKKLARRMGVKGTPYPTVTESQRNCILCGLCTSVCEEIIGRAAIGILYKNLIGACRQIPGRITT